MKNIINIKLPFICLFMLLLSLVGCSVNSTTTTTTTYGTIEYRDLPYDIYSYDDYYWNDVISEDQIEGVWHGSMVVDVMPENGFSGYDMIVTLTFEESNIYDLYILTEEHDFYNAVVANGDDCESLIDYYYGLETGSLFNPYYDIDPSAGHNNNFEMYCYEDIELGGYAVFEEVYVYNKNAEAAVGNYIIKPYILGISEDETKLLLQYSDDVNIVLGR